MQEAQQNSKPPFKASKSEFTFKFSIFGRPRQLTLSPEFLEFDDNDKISSIPTKFLNKDIDGLRYGVKWIQVFGLDIGRIYCIDISSMDALFLIVEYDMNNANRWVPYPLHFRSLKQLFQKSGYGLIEKLREYPSVFQRARMYSATIRK
jgi:hypothetical protein